MEKGYVLSPSGQVHYRIENAGAPGRPLLLLHPTPKSGWIYETIMPLLAVNRAVIAPDTPGYGASSPLDGPVSIDAFAETNFNLLDTLQQRGLAQVGAIDVLGYHTGSATAVRMAALAPKRVGHLILASLPAYDREIRQAKLNGLRHWPRPKADGSHVSKMWALVRSLTDARASIDWMHASFSENLRCGARAPDGYEAVYRYDLLSALPKVAHPTMVINAEDDLSDLTKQVYGLIPGVRYETLRDTMHGMFDFLASDIARLVNDFLSHGRQVSAPA